MNETRKERFRNACRLARKSIGAATRTVPARAAMLGLALGVTASVSAAPASPDKVHQTSAAEPHAKQHWYQVGRASWYGNGFNGKRTANGERFNQNLLTCAHRSLPLGSWIRVTNLSNNKSTFVRVTDRGPFVKNVVLDLSYAAAHKLGFNSLAKVRIDKVSPEDPSLIRAVNLAQLQTPASEDLVGGQ